MFLKILAVNRFPQDNARTWAGLLPLMQRANFCAECGERLTFDGWRGWLRRSLCGNCARRLGGFTAYRSLVLIVLIALGAFAFGRYLRPAPPPLIIQRAANSPLFGAANEPIAQSNRGQSNQLASVSNDEVYVCGARTKKGTPCRRRVHAAGERCFQHKGMPAMVALDKLTVKSTK